MKIIRQISENRYEIEIENQNNVRGLRQIGMQIVHDYIAFSGKHWFRQEDNSSSSVAAMVGIHMPIKTFIDVAMPLLLEHKYTKQDHLKEREDGKGGKYFPYTETPQAFRYWDEVQKTMMVAFHRRGEAKINRVTIEVFNNYIINSIDWVKDTGDKPLG